MRRAKRTKRTKRTVQHSEVQECWKVHCFVEFDPVVTRREYICHACFSSQSSDIIDKYVKIFPRPDLPLLLRTNRIYAQALVYQHLLWLNGRFILVSCEPVSPESLPTDPPTEQSESYRLWIFRLPKA
jgi:hypothetical protein